MDPNKLLTTQEAADYLGISKAFLERDRWKGAVIPFVKIGGRTVRYRKCELDSFIDKSITPYKRSEPVLGESSNG